VGQWAHFRQVSPRLLERLVSDPRLVLGLLALGRGPTDQRHGQMLVSLPEEARAQAAEAFEMFEQARDLDCFADERARERWGLELLRSERFIETDSPTEINIEKRWRGLHEVLERQPTAEAVQLGYAVIGGKELGEDLGYGPVRYLTPAQVARTADELRAFSPEGVHLRMEAGSAGISGFEYIWEALEAIRDYDGAASAGGFGILLFFG